MEAHDLLAAVQAVSVVPCACSACAPQGLGVPLAEAVPAGLAAHDPLRGTAMEPTTVGGHEVGSAS